ncbi:amidase [Bordetella trematum]|uniref:amidase n=1 Tax=Bordetella trematum TaxID=123899 RepID=UPI0039891E5C
MSKHDALIRLTASEAVRLLKRKEISPLDLIDASQARVSEIEAQLNALPTACFDRARERARQWMAAPADPHMPGWLGGLPVSIKDMTEVAGVRTTYGSPLYQDFIPNESHPLVTRIEAKGALVVAKSNTPEFAAGGSTFNPVFGATRNPWNTALTCGGSSGGAAVSVATGQVWLAHGSDHGGSLRRPASYCGVVGLRPSPGRVTRGTVDTLFSPLQVEGPMARNIPDLALFLDAMAGHCVHDPMTYDSPARSYVQAVEAALAQGPRRIAYCGDFDGAVPVDRETLALCEQAVRRFEEAGCIVEAVNPDIAALADAFLILRSQVFVVEREHDLAAHRERIKADVVWNTELGLTSTASAIAWAERERAAFYRRMAAIFSRYDVFVTPAAPTPAFDVNLRNPATIAGRPLQHYLAGSMLCGAISMTGCPAVSLPCGFDQYGRPLGLQIVAPPRRDDLALQVAALYEQICQYDRLLPISPRTGAVPPAEAPLPA